MDSPIHRSLGLTDEEARSIDTILGRPANHLELAMYAVMWSEHCSYKSSRVHLRRLPTSGERVLVGPGENAGVIDAGGGVAVAIRIESHNHPSAIEPYQGAATGVGGIIRDIFTMGARPIALMDPLRFGPRSDAKSRWIAAGVVSGISGYGNSVGVPTVGGEIVFDESFAGNPLVNVLCLGVLPAERLVLGKASGPGNLAVLLGSSTGRDGIGGVSVLASAGFTDDAELEASKRPNVQVGDPYEEKRLIEACLSLLDESLVLGIQDLGGAGLTCATSETASRGGVGMDVDVTAVPTREPAMAAWEVMTSESQERMLAIVAPENVERVLEVCGRWEVNAAVVGRVTDTGRLRILDGWAGPVLADVPAASLHEDAPLYHREMSPPKTSRPETASCQLPCDDPGSDLARMLEDPSWIYRQYDHQLFLNTVVAPGADAALLRLAAPGVRRPAPGVPYGAVAVSTDGNSRWCAVDPRRGAALLVAESALNVACVGADAVAMVNCLNFGNPEHPEVMWQLSEAVDGMAEACRELSVPVVGGNVSLYNESGGLDIDPTPVVAVVGLVERLEKRPPVAVLTPGELIVLLSPDPVEVSLSGSKWAVEVHGHRGRGENLPALDFAAHRRLLRLVADLVGQGVPSGVHDVSEGGLAVALAEMAVGSGCGFVVSLGETPGATELFGEGPSRVLMCLPDALGGEVRAKAESAGLVAVELGRAGGERLVIEGAFDVAVSDVTASWRTALASSLAPGGFDGH